MAYDGHGEAALQPMPQDQSYRPARSLTRRPRQDSDPSGHETAASSARHVSPNLSDAKADEKVSVLDPRRFTPTLHANLVSEILALRRDLDAKTQFIEGLETTLNSTKQELDTTAITLQSTSKETRSLRRQMQLLEGGTSSALGELARERDEAADAAVDLKKKLEASQKKLRNKEDDNDRTHSLWERDRDNWEAERRKLEHKVHVVEGRLKSVLDEFANVTHTENLDSIEHDDERDGAMSREDDRISETASVQSSPRRTRMTRSSMRYSMLSGPNGYGGPKMGGMTLAEELEAGDSLSEPESEHDDGTVTDTGADSTSSGHKHTESLDSTELNRASSVTDMDDLAEGKPDELVHDKSAVLSPMPCVYVDTGVQFTPPASPVLEADPALSSAPDDSPKSHDGVALAAVGPLPCIDMISSSSQTDDLPLSPPWTPSTADAPFHNVPKHSLPTPKPSLEMISSATQTLGKKPAPEPIVMQIPLITIHPPTSRPSSPRIGILPPHNKDVAVQADLKSNVRVRSVSMQTEEIKIDQRPVKLPPHLLPSAISSKPPTPEPQEPAKAAKPSDMRVKKQRQRAAALNSKLKAIAKDGNLRKPLRSSSLFGSYEVASSDDADDCNETEISDNDFKTALSARPRGKHRLSRVASKQPRTVPEESGDSAGSKERQSGKLEDSSTPLVTAEIETKPVNNFTTRQPNIRKAALISSGTIAHAQRARSPSLGTATVSTTTSSRIILDPPFPVPTRASSRGVPLSSSEGTRSPTRSSFNFSNRSSSDRYTTAINRDTLRKSRSAYALPRGGFHERPRSRSPPPMSPSSAAPDSPQPPLPRDDITNPYAVHRKSKHAHQASIATNNTGNASIASSLQQTNVVDAIAQTMIGEWMWKYVRRRKSFGVPESPPHSAWDSQRTDDATGNGQRHKRWVWLAPYDRSVMWASRQPTTGSALMGKSGRKLVIQSVLDVKDETPLKQGGQPAFNRSILILTPARALKFTAVSKERHYVWLTALSFLSHSASGPGEILLPPLPFHESALPAAPQTRPTSRSNWPIRDSIRISKGKRRLFGTEDPIREVDSGDAAASNEGSEAAAAPHVPRFSNHMRKRSNTGPKTAPPPHPALTQPRSSSHNNPVPQSAGGLPATGQYQPSLYSTHTATSSDLYYNITGPNFDQFSSARGGTSFSVRPSTDAPSSTSFTAAPANFFDAVGTIRMEAFVERTLPKNPTQYAEIEDPFAMSGPPSATTWTGRGAGNRNSGMSNGSSRWSRILSNGPRPAGNYVPRGKTAPGPSENTSAGEFWGVTDDFFGIGERGMGSGRILGAEDPFKEFSRF